MIKLIATDLDNTLLDKQGLIPDSTAALLHEAAEKGVVTAVATGRCFPSALGAARTIGAHTPVICPHQVGRHRRGAGPVLCGSGHHAKDRGLLP